MINWNLRIYDNNPCYIILLLNINLSDNSTWANQVPWTLSLSLHLKILPQNPLGNSAFWAWASCTSCLTLAINFCLLRAPTFQFVSSHCTLGTRPWIGQYNQQPNIWPWPTTGFSTDYVCRAARFKETQERIRRLQMILVDEFMLLREISAICEISFDISGYIVGEPQWAFSCPPTRGIWDREIALWFLSWVQGLPSRITVAYVTEYRLCAFLGNLLHF